MWLLPLDPFCYLLPTTYYLFHIPHSAAAFAAHSRSIDITLSLSLSSLSSPLVPAARLVLPFILPTPNPNPQPQSLLGTPPHPLTPSDAPRRRDSRRPIIPVRSRRPLRPQAQAGRWPSDSLSAPESEASRKRKRERKRKHRIERKRKRKRAL